jgi:DNA-binding transcriptional LysR family regulator
MILCVHPRTFQAMICTISVRKQTDGVDWDGLRYFRSVAVTHTLTGAARRLRVQHTTVARQLDRLERALGARLFLRNPRGYVLTRVGEALLESVEAISARVDEVARLAGGEDIELAGTLRVATADLLATHLVVPALRPLLDANNQLDLAIVSDTRPHNLSRREADLALRLGAASEPHLVRRRVAEVGFGLYAARFKGKRIDIEQASYVGFDDTVGRQPHDEWLETNAPRARVVLRANRQQTLIEAVRLGVGLGILPCLAADSDDSLVRLLGPPKVFSRDLCVVMHPDVRHARRVRAVIESIEAYAAAHAKRIAGVSSARRRR